MADHRHWGRARRAIMLTTALAAGSLVTGFITSAQAQDQAAEDAQPAGAAPESGADAQASAQAGAGAGAEGVKPTTLASGVASGSVSGSTPGPDVIQVQGLRGSLQRSMQVKRNNSVVSDALVGVEIGDLPDLSIAESLERISGLAAGRFKGGSTEIAIRGLGAFLGASTLNGRELTSGSDGRSVNFGQFPSELMQGAIVYKSQQASFVEGGVSGTIELQTLRPLDYGRRRLQSQALVGWNDAELRVVDGEDYNQRYTMSFVDQFETPLGALGISLGGQLRDDTSPEDVYYTSSGYRPCNTIYGVDSTSNCAYLTDGDGNPTGASDTYLISNQYFYRALETDTNRNSFMGAVQWRPTAAWDINLDYQYSFREDEEQRHALLLSDGRYRITPIHITDSGALQAWQGQSRILNQTSLLDRTEAFEAVGLNVEWSKGPLTLVGDFGYNKTERRQDFLDMSARTEGRAIFELDTRGVDVPNLTFVDVSAIEQASGLVFDLDNHDQYTYAERARRFLENVDDESMSLRLDANYTFTTGFVESVDVGLRLAERHRVRDDGIDTTFDDITGYSSAAAIAARQDVFPVDSLYDGADTAMTGITWATWDPRTLFNALAGDPDRGLPTGSTLSAEDTDLTEFTYAAYAQANFDTTMFGQPALGNFGLRLVGTDSDSLGISQSLETTEQTLGSETSVIITATGDAVISTESNGYVNVLPSANLSLDLSDTTVLRLAAYSAIARPSPEILTAAVRINGQADLDSVGEIISAQGNPYLEPLKSHNFDVSYEWYRSADTSLATSVYYKYLQTGLETVSSEVIFNVDGVATPLLITRQGNSDDPSDLWGVEFAVQHVFSQLPGALSGLGIQGSWNYAESTFETPDPSSTDGVNALADFTDPANISGYSRNTGNLTVFWENDFVNLRLAYKGRSSFLRPRRNTSNRFNAAQESIDFSARYRLNRAIALRAQALNLTNEPTVYYRPVMDSLGGVEISGRRFFFGIQGRF